jgi:hypothetical protein
MRPSFTFAFSSCALAAILSTTFPAAAADNEQAALRADHALSQALGKNDKDAVSQLLDAKFEFTDTDGKVHGKPDVLGDLSGLANMNGEESAVETHFYGNVETVLGAHHGARFLRIWVKRPAGWKAFVALDTVVTPAPHASVEVAAGSGDCDNPCKTVPYTPTTKMDKEILAAWQKTKMEELHYDADNWDKDIGSEFYIINNTTMRNKAERMVIARKQQADKVGAPGDPVTKMQIFDFGPTAAVIFTDHVPYRGGKPYHNVRVAVKRDGRWQLVISQQTNVKDAAPVPAVAASK